MKYVSIHRLRAVEVACSLRRPGRAFTALALHVSRGGTCSAGKRRARAPVPGNMVSYGTATYEYDALNVLRKSVIDGVTRSYVHTPSDERIATLEQTGTTTMRSE